MSTFHEFARGSVVCIEEEIADDDGDDPAVAYFVERLCNKVIMNRKVAELLVVSVVQPLIAKRWIANGDMGVDRSEWPLPEIPY